LDSQTLQSTYTGARAGDTTAPGSRRANFSGPETSARSGSFRKYWAHSLESEMRHVGGWMLTDVLENVDEIVAGRGPVELTDLDQALD